MSLCISDELLVGLYILWVCSEVDELRNCVCGGGVVDRLMNVYESECWGLVMV